MKVDPTSLAWLSDWVGEYWSEELGPARISRKGDGFWAQFESWGSALGVVTEQNGDRVIALTSPPWGGTLRLQITPETKTLVIDGDQHRYTFERRNGHQFN